MNGDIQSSKFSIYMSHSIRGIKGAAATRGDMDANNQKAMNFGAELKQAFPNIDFYIPAEHDEFVLVAYEKHYVNESNILNVDCTIINSRNMVLTWSPDQFISNGMMTELIHASVAGKSCAVVRNMDEAKLVIDAALGRKMR